MLKSLILAWAPSVIPNIARQAGLTAGGALLAIGFADASGSQLIGGAITVAISSAWAFAEKKGLLAKIF